MDGKWISFDEFKSEVPDAADALLSIGSPDSYGTGFPTETHEFSEKPGAWEARLKRSRESSSPLWWSKRLKKWWDEVDLVSDPRQILVLTNPEAAKAAGIDSEIHAKPLETKPEKFTRPRTVYTGPGETSPSAWEELLSKYEPNSAEIEKRTDDVPMTPYQKERLKIARDKKAADLARKQAAKERAEEDSDDTADVMFGRKRQPLSVADRMAKARAARKNPGRNRKASVWNGEEETVDMPLPPDKDDPQTESIHVCEMFIMEGDVSKPQMITWKMLKAVSPIAYEKGAGIGKDSDSAMVVPDGWVSMQMGRGMAVFDPRTETWSYADGDKQSFQKAMAGFRSALIAARNKTVKPVEPDTAQD